jgi:hypothetical protein
MPLLVDCQTDTGIEEQENTKEKKLQEKDKRANRSPASWNITVP